jgi:hypothetical protein
MHWFAKSYTDVDSADRLISLVIAAEALFLENEAELSHRFAERGAVLIAAERPNKIETYQELKQAYGVRSKLVHGKTVSPDEAHECFTKMDDFMRVALNTMLRLPAHERPCDDTRLWLLRLFGG